MKKSLKIFIILSLVIVSLFISLKVYAYDPDDPRFKHQQSTEGKKDMVSFLLVADLINPDDYDPSKSTEEVPTIITEKAGAIFTIIQIVAIVISVIVIAIMGIKYLMGSVEQKADYKKTMIPYIVGVVLLVSIPTLIRVIYNLTLQASQY